MKHLILFFLGLFLTGFSVNAQNNSNEELPSLYMEAKWDGENINVHWSPTNATIWKAGWENGYQVDRQLYFLNPDTTKWAKGEYVYDTLKIERGTSSFPVSGEQIANGGLEWMNQNLGLGNGFGELINDFLFDSATINQIASNRTEEEFLALQYQHTQFSNQYFPEGDVGLGLGYEDIHCDTFAGNPFMLCRYTVSVIGYPNYSAVVDAFPNPNFPKGKNYERYKYQKDLVKFEIIPDAPRLSDNLFALSRAYEDSIVVRWAAKEGYTWRKSLEKGFRIIKYELPDVDINQLILENKTITPEMMIGTPIDTNYVAKWDSAKFETALESKDSMLLIAAMAVYGNAKSGAKNQKEEADALRNSYAYALYAAEISPAAANSLGLRFVDYNVEKGKKYRYKIHFADQMACPVSAKSELKNVFMPLPKPIDFRMESGEYTINLFMDRYKNEEIFSFYFFEKSADGGTTWEKMNKKAKTFTFDEIMDAEVTQFTLTDSVPELYKKYKYRVRGQNPFNELSEWATIDAWAVDLTPPSAPIINEPTQETATMASITWEETSKLEFPDLLGYKVYLSSSGPERAKPISELIPAGNNSFLFNDEFRIDRPYFFSVSAIDTAGNEEISPQFKLTIIDSIPPLAPAGLSGNIDTNGIVTVFWPHNSETDLKGYRVYFANDTTLEFSQLTSEEIQYNYYRDSIEVNSLNDEIYYIVQAVDERYNMSDYSKILTLKRPDIVPPAAPVLLQPEPGEKGINLIWRPSSSDDVVFTYVYRREVEGDTAWRLLDSVVVDSSGYVDASAKIEKVYEYTIDAMDDAGLYSDRSFPIKGRRFFVGDIQGVSGISATQTEQQVALSWAFGGTKDEFLEGKEYRFTVYRAIGPAPMERYKFLKGKDPAYVDKNVETGTIYRYAIGVVFEDGKKSKISSEAIIKIKEQ